MDDSGFDVDCGANLRFGVAPALLANQRVAQLLKGKHHPREISALFVALEGFSIVLFRLAVPPRVSAEVAPVQLSVHQESGLLGQVAPCFDQPPPQQILRLAHLPLPIEDTRPLDFELGFNLGFQGLFQPAGLRMGCAEVPGCGRPVHFAASTLRENNRGTHHPRGAADENEKENYDGDSRENPNHGMSINPGYGSEDRKRVAMMK